ncbi:MAG: GNAT family N-acetyltransferase [Clostridiales bacterium]|nr:GNAT family N-acetyltransferase [Clostridiales bacterium]
MKLARLDSDIGRAQNAYDVFVALDDAGRRVGKCSIVPYKADDLLPDCPFNIFIDLDGELRSMDMLLGAALASAEVVHRTYPKLEARVYAGCAPDDSGLIDVLKTYGFRVDDREVGMIKTLYSDPFDADLPQGMSFISDKLESREDSRRTLARINATFGENRSEDWLERLKREPGFKRIAVIDINGPVGEALVYEMDQSLGVIAMLIVEPRARRKGVAQFLLECARIHFVSRGLSMARADVWERLEPARRLFEHCGYFAKGDTWYFPGFMMDSTEGRLS